MNPTETLIATVERYGAHNYQPLPIVLCRAAGEKVWDVEGREYLDFLSCYSALNFGHQHPKLVAALMAQVQKLALCSRAFHNEELCYFSQELAEFCKQEAVLLMNTGTEAVETALKLVRKWGAEKKKIREPKVIVCRNNFHGRTISIISFSTEQAYRDGFGPYTPGFSIIPFGDSNALEQAIDSNTVAFLVEPIQAEAGVLIPPPAFLSEARNICNQRGILMVVDEVQTGMGRTGKRFCLDHFGVVPDLVVLGKSLGGGLIPLSAVVGKKELIGVFRPGEHGSTFGGNPLAAAVGRACLKLFQEENLDGKGQKLGETIRRRLGTANLSKIKEIRGMGALIGLELVARDGSARPFCEALAKQGVLCKETHENVIRIAPPLTISDANLENGLTKIISVLR